jgi:hypothetical protein
MTHTILMSPHPSRGKTRRVPCRLTQRLVIVREHGPEHGGIDFNRNTGRAVGGGYMASHVDLDSLEELE